MSSTPRPTSKFFTLTFAALMLGGSLFFTSCNSGSSASPEVKKQLSLTQVNTAKLRGVRLGDGVPLIIDVSVRWTVEDAEAFAGQFNSTHAYDSLILQPRQLELASKVANNYDNVDSVFTSHRHRFVENLKDYLLTNLGEEGIAIREVIVSKIHFPNSYTDAREKIAMQERELESIRKGSVVALESAEAAKKQATAQGEVDMAKAQMDAKIEQINAETEKSRRKSQLARAETQKQVARLQAQAEAEKLELLAQTDLKKQRALKDLAHEDKRKQDQLEVEKQRGIDQLTFDTDLKMAKLCSENPVYANYMVNKELASKVQIAVLPSGQDASVFNGLLGNSISAK